jgi:hypothetical protein|tara:strand:- start:1007 stop:1201 length:195 start_codon:yes stop_codon:yes gene_type:complete
VDQYLEATEFVNGGLNQFLTCISILDISRHRVDLGTCFVVDTFGCLLNPRLISTRDYNVTTFLG